MTLPLALVRWTSHAQKKRAAPRGAALPFVSDERTLEVHVAHAAHAAARHSARSRRARLLLRLLAHHRFGGDEKAGDRGRVLEGAAHDLGRVDDAGLHE